MDLGKELGPFLVKVFIFNVLDKVITQEYNNWLFNQAIDLLSSRGWANPDQTHLLSTALLFSWCL